MSRKAVGAVGTTLVAIVIAAIAITSCGGGGKTHKATCWNPDYAAAPTATWAKHPSPTHRHGAGPRGKDICDGK